MMSRSLEQDEKTALDYMRMRLVSGNADERINAARVILEHVSREREQNYREQRHTAKDRTAMRQNGPSIS